MLKTFLLITNKGVVMSQTVKKIRTQCLQCLMTLALVLNTSPVIAKDIQNNGPHYGQGIIIGRPLKASESGLFIKTWELEINKGGFQDNNNYLGTTFHASTEDPTTFNIFPKLDSTKTYVFAYTHKNPVDFEVEESNLQVMGVQPLLTNFAASGLPAEVTSKVSNPGWYSSGNRSGRVVQVERWGAITTDCTIRLNLGGLGGQGHEHEENTVDFLANDDEACTYAENVAMYGLDVEITYTQDMVEIWEMTPYRIHKIRVINPKQGSPNAAGPQLSSQPTNSERTQAPQSALTPEQIEEVKQMLLRDPEFIEELKARLKNE